MRPPAYADRVAAGRVLARCVAGRLAAARPTAPGPTGAAPPDVVVLALPRGGVPVARPVADHLGAVLDVVVVRKLGLPWQPELAMGAVARVGASEHVVANEAVLAGARVPEPVFDQVLAVERGLLAQRSRWLRGDRADLELHGRVAVIVDDGMATGATVRAAVAAVRGLGAARVVVAVPVASRQAVAAVADEADEVICPWTPRPFVSVGHAYRDFSQTSDEEVRQLLGT